MCFSFIFIWCVVSSLTLLKPHYVLLTLQRYKRNTLTSNSSLLMITNLARKVSREKIRVAKTLNNE